MLPHIARAWKSWAKALVGKSRPRPLRRARPRLGGEELESRLAPANVTWTGGAGTLNWTDADNWSTHATPGTSDDVTISGTVSGPIAISGTQSIHSLTDTSAALVLSSGSLTLAAASTTTKNLTLTSGTLTVNGSLTVTSATFAFNGGSIGGTVTLGNSALAIGPGSTGSASFVLEGSDTLSGNITSGQSLWVQGNNPFGNATLAVADGVANHGTILLQSISGGYTDTLAAAGAFTNADGTIQVNAGTGGPRSLTGTVTNQGTVDVAAGTILTVNGGAGSAAFTNQGVVAVDPAGLATFSQVYTEAGGAIAGPGYVYYGTLREAAAPAAGTTILVDGATALATDNLPGVTVWAEGNDLFNYNVGATLTAADGVANHGTILLQSISGGYTDTLAAAGAFTNAADGTIQVNAGTGGSRTISAALINEGTANFDTNATLGSTGASHINAGLLSMTGATVAVTGSSFTNVLGGLISGDGTFSTSGVTRTNSGIIDLARPSILGVDAELSSVAITFDDAGAMDATTVTNPANYTLLGSGGDGLFGNGNDADRSGLISQVSYNATTKTVTLHLSGQLPADVYWVEVNGSAVRDAAGTALLPGQTDLVNRVVGVVPAQVAIALDPASDSGASNHDGLTKVTRPTFDVQVNQAGTIGVDFNGDGTTDATLSVSLPGTYQFTAPTLANGTYTA